MTARPSLRPAAAPLLQPSPREHLYGRERDLQPVGVKPLLGKPLGSRCTPAQTVIMVITVIARVPAPVYNMRERGKSLRYRALTGTVGRARRGGEWCVWWPDRRSSRSSIRR